MPTLDDATFSKLKSPRPRPWLSLYPTDLPTDGVTAAGSIIDHFANALAKRPDKEAIRYFDASLSYSEVDRLSDAFAIWLAEAGVGAGDRVAVVLQNVPHSYIATFAIWKLGAIPVPGNPMYTTDELARIFADYSPRVIICHGYHAATVRNSVDAGVEIVTVGAHDFQTLNDERLLPVSTPYDRANDFYSLCLQRIGQAPPAINLDPNATGLLLYTSGTTGAPKGVKITHRSLAINSATAAIWMHIDSDARVLGLAPLFHITGFVLHMGVSVAAGCSLALHYRVHPEAVLDVIRDYRPTCTVAAITAFNALMNAPGAAKGDFASFEQVFTGGAPVPPALRDTMARQMGINLMPIYGMTESCAPTHIAPVGSTVPLDPSTGALAVGVPTSATDARIMDADGVEVPTGVAGEIWVTGPQIMSGYWNKSKDTEEVLIDGWLRTGDVGFMDEAGWFYVIDRQKDMINASGFKVWPREVEDVLHEHPFVREAAVVGVPDPYRGETVLGYVSLLADADDVVDADLVAHCRERLAAYKCPRQIIIVDDLPKTATGKVQRTLLREEALTRLQGR